MGLTKDELDLVMMSEIRSLLNHFLKPIPNITTYHNFRVNSSQPGTVFLRTYSVSDVTQCTILQAGFSSVSTGMPEKTLFPE